MLYERLEHTQKFAKVVHKVHQKIIQTIRIAKVLTTATVKNKELVLLDEQSVSKSNR